MPSPFPGMDPYLEDPSVWPNFHSSFIPAMRRFLRALVPPGNRVRLDERIYVESVNGERLFRPDLAVSKWKAEEKASSVPEAGSQAVGTLPGTLLLRTAILEEHREVFLEIRADRSGELITLIELLSPANKRAGSEGRALHLRKRNLVLQSPAHLVEIDLLRGGERVPMAEQLPDCPYLVVLSRAVKRPVCEVTPIPLHSKLPKVLVPLSPPDPDVMLDLQAVFNEVYDEAGYRSFLDYRQQPPPPGGYDLDALVKTYVRKEELPP